MASEDNWTQIRDQYIGVLILVLVEDGFREELQSLSANQWKS